MLSRPEHHDYSQFAGEALFFKIKGFYWYNGFPIIHIDWLDWRAVYDLVKPASELTYDLKMKAEESVFNAAGWVLDGFGRRNVPVDICHKIPSYTPVGLGLSLFVV